MWLYEVEWTGSEVTIVKFAKGWGLRKREFSSNLGKGKENS
jgi:hypothetical protein